MSSHYMYEIRSTEGTVSYRRLLTPAEAAALAAESSFFTVTPEAASVLLAVGQNYLYADTEGVACRIVAYNGETVTYSSNQDEKQKLTRHTISALDFKQGVKDGLLIAI